MTPSPQARKEMVILGKHVSTISAINDIRITTNDHYGAYF